MKKKSRIVVSVGLAVTILFCTVIFLLPKDIKAGSKVLALEGVGYNVNSSMEDNLKSLTDKKVYVSLDSGGTLAG